VPEGDTANRIEHCRRFADERLEATSPHPARRPSVSPSESTV
jgi:hypothetical protein